MGEGLVLGAPECPVRGNPLVPSFITASDSPGTGPWAEEPQNWLLEGDQAQPAFLCLWGSL